MTTEFPFDGYIMMDGWSGRYDEPVKVIGETPKRYKVVLKQNCRLPGRLRHGNEGQEILVPKYAIKPQKQSREKSQ